MDIDLRQLQRDYLADPNRRSGQRLLQAAFRSGKLSDSILEILSLSATMIARRYGYQAQPPSLYFVCGVNEDPNLHLEVERITWFRRFREQRFLWFKVILACLHHAYNLIFASENTNTIIPMFDYPRKQYPSHRGPKRRNDAPGEFLQLQGDLLRILDFLHTLSPTTGAPTAEQLDPLLQIINYWCAVTTEEGDLNYGASAPANPHRIWRQRKNWQGALNNLIEILHHLLYVLSGSVGEPHRVGSRSNRRYTGCPFLLHWEREHGTLNPGHHLVGIGNDSPRITQLVDASGMIDWFIVYSNAIVAAYHVYIFSLAAHRQLTWKTLHPEGRNLDDEPTSSTEQELDHLLEQSQQWEQENIISRPDYHRLETRDNRIHDRFLELTAEEDLPEDDPRLVRAQAEIERIAVQMEAIRNEVFNAHPEARALIQRIEELQNRVEAERRTTATTTNAQLENRFWIEFGPIIESAVIDYLARTTI